MTDVSFLRVGFYGRKYSGGPEAWKRESTLNQRGQPDSPGWSPCYFPVGLSS